MSERLWFVTGSTRDFVHRNPCRGWPPSKWPIPTLMPPSRILRIPPHPRVAIDEAHKNIHKRRAV